MSLKTKQPPPTSCHLDVNPKASFTEDTQADLYANLRPNLLMLLASCVNTPSVYVPLFAHASCVNGALIERYGDRKQNWGVSGQQSNDKKSPPPHIKQTDQTYPSCFGGLGLDQFVRLLEFSLQRGRGLTGVVRHGDLKYEQ